MGLKPMQKESTVNNDAIRLRMARRLVEVFGGVSCMEFYFNLIIRAKKK
jgi:hypothetical protein